MADGGLPAEDGQLLIPNSIIQRLNNCESEIFCQLYGFKKNNRIFAVSFVIREQPNKESEFSSKFSITESNFPSPVSLIGIVFGDNKSLTQNDLQDKSQLFFNHSLIITFNYVDKSMKCYRYEIGKIIDAAFEIIQESDIWNEFLIICLKSELLIKDEHSVSEGVEHTMNRIKCSNSAVFRIDGSDVCINDNNYEGISCQSIFEKVLESDEHSGSRYEVMGNKVDVLNAKLLVLEEDAGDASGDKKITIDGLVMCQKTAPIPYDDLIVCVRRLLILNYCNYTNINDATQIYHFYPQELGHFITFSYPSKSTETDLVPFREYLHFGFGLPRNKPIFTRGKKFEFEKIEDGLTDVHVGINKSGIKNGEMSLVVGTYTYYHYKQHNFNDIGWGCAYRSLQTVFSWYKWQGWTDRSVPSHKEIQEILVEIGDKPKSFIGSRQWIGSLEVSYILDKLLSVTCRVLTVQNGESISLYAYELASHFKNHGSPIMIGGGVLAHTIIGVHIDDETEETSFLVLDPHYTGPDVLQSIRNKSGVGWKKPNFWKNDTFYNLCLPYRKTGV